MREKYAFTSTVKKTGEDPISVIITTYFATKQIVTAKDLTTKSNNFIIPQDIKLNSVNFTIKIQLSVNIETSALLLIPKKKYSSLLLIPTTTILIISSITIKLFGALTLKSNSRNIQS